MQALLQVLIICTGNYNFFNLMVILLCTLLVPTQGETAACSGSLDEVGPFVWLQRLVARAEEHRSMRFAYHVLNALFHAYATMLMVSLDVAEPQDASGVDVIVCCAARCPVWSPHSSGTQPFLQTHGCTERV